MRKYGWPLVLFVVIPFVAILSQTVTYYFLDTYTSGNTDSMENFFWPSAAQALTTAVLLSILYPWVRNSGRALLGLVWGFTLVNSGMSTLLYFGASFTGYDNPLHLTLSPWVHLTTFLLYALPLLWFARRASRTSLAHAFFLVFIVGGLTLPDLPKSLPFYLGWLWGLGGNLISIWLLANFDLYGLRFRRFVSIAVVVLAGVPFLPLLWTPIFFPVIRLISLLQFPLQLALIYLVRVRRPPVEAGLVPDVPTTSKGDEH